MCSNWFSKSTSVFVAITHLVLSLFLALPNHAYAQAVDTDPPSIEVEAVPQGVVGETQVFSATVTDNNTISSINLYYRFGDDVNYTALPMVQIVGTSIFTASVETTNESTPVIQYYLEARDAGGNRTVQGFAFDPLERVLVAQQPSVIADAAGTAAIAPTPPNSSGNRNIVFGVVAAVLVASIFALTSGGDDDDDEEPEETELTIIVDNF